MSGLGRIGIPVLLSEGSLTKGDDGGETALSKVIPAFHAGGDGAWKSS